MSSYDHFQHQKSLENYSRYLRRCSECTQTGKGPPSWDDPMEIGAAEDWPHIPKVVPCECAPLAVVSLNDCQWWDSQKPNQTTETPGGQPEDHAGSKFLIHRWHFSSQLMSSGRRSQMHWHWMFPITVQDTVDTFLTDSIQKLNISSGRPSDHQAIEWGVDRR